jgi:hypothetical protein
MKIGQANSGNSAGEQVVLNAGMMNNSDDYS